MMAEAAGSRRSSGCRYLPPKVHLSMPYDESRSRGAAAAELGALMGYPCQEWQRAMLMDMGGRSEDGTHYANPVVGGSIPRQCGKSIVGIIWAAYRALAEGATVLWTDHNYSTTSEMYQRFRTVFGSRPHDPAARYPAINARLRGVSAKTAQESFFFKAPYDGAPEGSIHFSTRTKSASLGYTFDLVVYDEAQELTGEQEQVIIPTTTSGALHDLQLVYLGTPTRPGSHGTSFRELRADALAKAPDTCWWEWGVDEVGDVDDEARWARVHPALASGVADVRAIRVGRRRLDAFGFAQEYLGYWYDAARHDALISRGEWAACASHVAPEGDPSAFGVKFSPDGGTVAVAVAVRLGDGHVHVELVSCGPTTHGISNLVHAIASDATGAAWAVDGRSGAKTLAERARIERAAEHPELDQWPREPQDVHLVGADEVTEYAQLFLDAVRERTLEWYSDGATDEEGREVPDMLTESVLTVTRRRIGSMGGWGFGGDSPTAAEAAAIAHWAAQRAAGLARPDDDMEVFF